MAARRRWTGGTERRGAGVRLYVATASPETAKCISLYMYNHATTATCNGYYQLCPHILGVIVLSEYDVQMPQFAIDSDLDILILIYCHGLCAVNN